MFKFNTIIAPKILIMIIHGITLAASGFKIRIRISCQSILLNNTVFNVLLFLVIIILKLVTFIIEL